MLADVTETDAILSGYREGVLEETRREIGEQRAAEAAAAGDKDAVVSSGKSKAAKRKQQKRKAQQQKKWAAEEAAAAAQRALDDAIAASILAGEEASATEEDGATLVEAGGQQLRLQEDIGGLTTATLGLTLQGAQEVEREEEREEEEEEEDCAICFDTLLGGESRLVCRHVYHASCLELWQRNCINKAIAPTCPYCRAPLQFEG